MANRMLAGRSIASALVLGIAAAATTGCRTESNGADGNFHFEAPGPGAVGEIVPVWVRRAGSLCGDRASVADGFCIPVDARIEQLTSAECADPTMCRVESTTQREDDDGLFLVLVRALREGETTIDVGARLGDGSEMHDRHAVSFATASQIRVRCHADSGTCGVRYATLPGQTFALTIGAARMLEGGQAEPLAATDFQASVEGDAVRIVLGPKRVGTDFDARAVTQRIEFKVIHAGESVIHLRGQSIERTLRVRVASPLEVVRGDVRRWGAARWNDGLDPDAEVLAPAAAPSTLWLGDRHFRAFEGDDGGEGSLVLALTLRDGSFALGGAGLLHATQPGIIEIRGFNPTHAARFDRLGPFAPSRFAIEPLAEGSNELQADIGTAHVSWTFDVVASPDQRMQ